MKIDLRETIKFFRPATRSQNQEVTPIHNKARLYYANYWKRRLIFILGCITSFILFPVFYGNAQQFQKLKKNSYNTYVYKISSAKAKEAFIGDRNKLADYCKVIVDSFPSDSDYDKKLPNGYYAFMNVEQNKVVYSLKSYTDLQVKISSRHHKHALVVFDKTGIIRKDVKVTMNEKKIPFHAATQSFNFFYKKEEGLITVHTNEGDVYFSYDDNAYESYDNFGERIRASKIYSLPERTVWYGRKQVRKLRAVLAGKSLETYTGYMAFNKPKYLPGDTVKMKSFIANSSGKPISEKLSLYLLDSYNYGKRKLLTTIQPAKKGNYVYEFILPDSLITGRDYRLEFEKGEKQVMSETFRLEDYQLDETSYKFNSDKLTYFYGEPIQLYLNGTDANGLPLMDASVDITAITEKINALEPRPVFVPYYVWKHTQKLDNIGETKITFPDSLIPRIGMSMRIKAVFKNSNNELHEESKVITIKRVAKEIKIKTEGGYILADYLEDNISVQKEGTITGEFDGEILLENKIRFPVMEEINPLVSNYIFQVGDLTEQKSIRYENEASISFDGVRSADSVFLILSNPFKLKVSYTLFRNKVKIAEGITDTLLWSKADKSTASYYVAYNYVWGGKMRSNTYILHVYEKNLHVNIEQPSEIYPGQKVAVRIKITDYKNKPVENINLTAATINSQFKNFQLPNVPYFGKYKRNRLPGQRVNEYGSIEKEDVEIEEIANTYTDTISPAILKRTGIDSLRYYKFFYPADGAYYQYDSILSVNAQFSPFIVRSGKIVNPWLIYLDGRLIYSVESDAKRKYAFSAESGYHQIRVRTRDHEYYMDSVRLKKGWKLDFSIDADRLPKNVTDVRVPTNYTEVEDRLLRSSLLLLQNNYYGPRAFIWQGSNVWELDSKRSGMTTVGPLTPWDSIHFIMKDHYQTEFILEPEYVYTLSKKTHKLVSFTKDYKSLQYSYPPVIFPGDTVFTKNDIPPDFVPPKMKVYFETPMGISNGEGAYHFKYTSDSTVYAIKFFPCGKMFTSGFYRGYTNTFNSLQAGYYTLMLITENGSLFKKDSILIKEGGTTYEDLRNIQFKVVDNTIFSQKTAVKNSDVTIATVMDSHYTAAGLPGSLRGVITDARSGETIPYAAIALFVNGKMVTSTFTDMDGNYAFQSLRAGTYTLKATSVGYEEIEKKNVSISKKAWNLDLEFKSVQTLNEVVVTATTVRREARSLGYSTSEIRGDSYVSAVSALQGKVAGVNIRSGSSKGSGLLGGSSSFVSRISPVPPISLTDTFNSEIYKNAKQVRDRFSDYAYWQPNLWTDKNGEAVFNAEFPDNITQWNSYVLAMGGKRYSGAGHVSTRSFKKLMATLSAPRFLIEGDESNVVGKSLNYTRDSLKILTSFKLNDNSTTEKSTVVKDALIEKNEIIAENEDTLTVSYSLRLADGFRDGEKEKIPVFPVGVEETSGTFCTLKKDTAFTIALDPTKDYELYAQDNALQMMLEELAKLEHYPYFCNEQTASKINGLLMEKKIREQLGEPVSAYKEQMILKLIQKLEKAQYPDGSWGWWPQSTSNPWMTAYITLALYKASAAGYITTKTPAAIEFLKRQLDVQHGPTLLYTLNALSEMKQTASYAANLMRLKTDSLSLYQQLMVIKIKQEQQMPYDTVLLKKYLRTDIMGNVYVGKETTDWYDNSIQLTLLAYKIFAKDPKMKFYKEGIGNYFLQEKRNGGWRNTLETASILETILPDMINKNDKRIKPAELKISGDQFNVSVKAFPFHTTIPKSGTSLHISKTGSYPVYFTTYTKYWNKQPGKVNGNFEVKTMFMQKNQIVKTLTAGVPAQLMVFIDVKKEAEYIMIEVPIPAGCSYGTNSTYYYNKESYREYLKNKTLIFCEKLSAGTHQFTINLQPRFTGKYTLNPAKAEMMYFPTFYGRDEIRKTVIKE
jgi:hypothetical protein